MYTTLSVLYIVFCVIFIAMILVQQKRSGAGGAIFGMGAQSGGFTNSNRGRSSEEKLVTYTKIAGAIFFAFTLLMSFL